MCLESQQRVEAALFRLLKGLVFRDDPGAEFGDLPLSQLRCLYIIAEHEGQKMNELSHRMEVKLPAASQIVGRLAKRGLVERIADADDRRVVRLALTPESRAKMQRLKRRRDARLAATLVRLVHEEIEQVTHALNLLAEAAEAVIVASRLPESIFDEESLADLVTVTRRASRFKAASPVD
jgi:DNA-binding MarR family transcriptional regulator